MKGTDSITGKMTLRRADQDRLIVSLSGEWILGSRIPSSDEVQKRLDSETGIKRVAFDTAGLSAWDSSVLTFLVRVKNLCSQRDLRFDSETLPQGVKRLLALASAAPDGSGRTEERNPEPLFMKVGTLTIQFGRSFLDSLNFIGETFVAFVRLLGGRARLRRSDVVVVIQECGVQALPIVSLISVLVGLILAFMGAVQLKLFGAQVYVASLVGIAMVRLMGAFMTGIIMAGRTGAAFAAELGTMQVNEEIDALKTLGISPVEFLVLPRIIGLTLMMPFLCLYADLMGILGGFLVGVGMLDLNPIEYLHQTRESVSLSYMWIGLFHSVVFGVLVSLAGCLRGMQCGRSASAVGAAATSAVVTGIVSVIVATGIITVVCDVLGI